MVYYQDSDPDVRRVRYEVRRFKHNLSVYLAVIVVLLLANLVTGGWWWGDGWGWPGHGFIFLVALVWGLVIAFQGARLFGDHWGSDWEERMVNHIVSRRRGYGRDPAPPPPPAQSGPVVPPSPGAAPPYTPPQPPQAASPGPIVTPPPPHPPQG